MTAVWVCQVRKEAFVGGESQRCRHAGTCENCKGRGLLLELDEDGLQIGAQEELCPVCKGTGQVSECGEMELIGGEPVEWCVVHDSKRSEDEPFMCEWTRIQAIEGWFPHDPCRFESQIRVGP